MKTEHFVHAMDWDAQERERLLRSSKTGKQAGWAGLALAALAVTSHAMLWPLKTVEWMVLRVDSLTGNYDVRPASQVDMHAKEMELTVLADLQRYTKSREAFTRAEAEDLYRTAYLMSCESERPAVDYFFKSDPASPVKTFTEGDSYRWKYIGTTMLPVDRPDVRVAQVRFDKTVVLGASQRPLTQRYIATIAFKYDKQYIPKKGEYLHYNALGFCAAQYRADPEGQPRPATAAELGAAAAPATANENNGASQ